MKVIHHWASNHLSLISKAITAWPIRSSWPPPPYQAFLAMCSEMSLFWLTCCPYRLQDYLFSVIILLLPYMQSNWSFVFLTSLNRDTFTNCHWFFVTVTKDLCSITNSHIGLFYFHRAVLPHRTERKFHSEHSLPQSSE